MLPKGLLWVGLFLLLLLTASAGVTIGRGVILARRAARRHLAEEARRSAENTGEQEVQPEEAEQDSFAEEVQNALGFVPADVPDDAYPDLAGVFVDTLTGDASPAAAAHIQAGDVITALNGKAITNPEDMMEIVKPLKTGSEVTAKLFRDGESLEVRIKTADPVHEPFKPETEPRNQGFLGLGDVDRRCCVPGTKTWGLEIRRIVDNSSADLAGLQTGDVIVEFDGRPVRTPGELARRIRAAAPRSKVKIKFYRGDTAQTAEVIMGHQTGGDDSGGDDSEAADDSGGDNV
ncbi:MAG: PDZ domain-containing protein [Blastocatellia bacterium]